MNKYQIEIDEKRLMAMMNPAFEPHPAQMNILRNLKKRNIIEAGRQFGKSLLVGYICIRELLKPNTSTWIIAPFLDQTEIIWDYVYPTASKYPETFKINISKKTIECPRTGSKLACKTAENQVGLLGKTLTGLIMDEAAEIPAEVWEQRLEPTLTVNNGFSIMISTPLSEENWFHKLFIHAKSGVDKDYAAFHYTSYDNPYQNKDELDKIRKRIPEMRFNQQYLAMPSSSSGSVFKGVDSILSGKPENPVVGDSGRYVLGWDPARSRDYSVVTVLDRETRQVVHFDRSTGLDWDVQVDRVVRTAQRYNNAKIVMDSTGQGDPVENAVRMLAYKSGTPIYVEGFKISHNAKKVELIENLAIMIQEWEIFYPKEFEEITHELKIFTYKESASNNTIYGAPSGEHDDCVISLALVALDLKKYPNYKKEKSRHQPSSVNYVQVY